MEAPVIARPNFNLPFVIQTDASNVGLGAVLSQTIDDKKHVICFASRSLSAAEKNYSTTEKECLTVIWAISKFRAYVEGYHFLVITDHSSLRWLHNLKNPTGRLARWSLSLLEYDYEIIHRKGSNHKVPDALSRLYERNTSDPGNHEKENLFLADLKPPTWYVRRFMSVSEFPERFSNWKIENKILYHYRPDPVISSLVKDLNEWKMVPSDQEREIILKEAHNDPQSGHLGTHKTYVRVASNYFWSGCY